MILSLLGLDNIVQFPTRDQAYFDYAYVNHPWLFSTQKRALLSTSNHAIIRIMRNILLRKPLSVHSRKSHRVIKQQLLAHNSIASYQSMLEASGFSVFRSESISEYAYSLSEYCQFCFDTCRPLEIICTSNIKITSPLPP